LRCQRAIDPNDINWLNLHISHRQRTRTLVLWILSLAISLVVVYAALGVLNDSGSVYSIVYPSIIFFVNSLVIPCAIEYVAIVARLLRYSEVENMQMWWNHVFLTLNTLLLPLAGLTAGVGDAWKGERITAQSLADLFEFGISTQWVSTLPRGIVRITEENVDHSSMFFLNYVLMATLVTNGTHVMRTVQTLGPAFCNLIAVTATDKRDSLKPFLWPWGYWYAWNISIVVIGLSLSAVMPSILLCAYAFFWVAHVVDEANLNSGYCDLGPDDCGAYTTRALHMVRQVIASWWFAMGLFLLCGVLRDMEKWSSECFIPWQHVAGGSGGLMVASVCYSAWESINHARKLHVINFELPDAEHHHWWTCVKWVAACVPCLLRCLLPSLCRDNTVPLVSVPSAPRPRASGKEPARTTTYSSLDSLLESQWEPWPVRDGSAPSDEQRWNKFRRTSRWNVRGELCEIAEVSQTRVLEDEEELQQQRMLDGRVVEVCSTSAWKPSHSNIVDKTVVPVAEEWPWREVPGDVSFDVCCAHSEESRTTEHTVHHGRHP